MNGQASNSSPDPVLLHWDQFKCNDKQGSLEKSGNPLKKKKYLCRLQTSGGKDLLTLPTSEELLKGFSSQTDIIASRNLCSQCWMIDLVFPPCSWGDNGEWRTTAWRGYGKRFLAGCRRVQSEKPSFPIVTMYFYKGSSFFGTTILRSQFWLQ